MNDTRVPRAAARRVLVVNESDLAEGGIARHLRVRGCEVYHVCGARAAVEAACAVFPEIILLDISAPGIEALRAIRRIRELQLPLQPLVVAAASWNDAHDRLVAEDAGVDVHLTKPLEMRVIRALLDSEIDATYEAGIRRRGDLAGSVRLERRSRRAA